MSSGGGSSGSSAPANTSTNITSNPIASWAQPIANTLIGTAMTNTYNGTVGTDASGNPTFDATSLKGFTPFGAQRDPNTGAITPINNQDYYNQVQVAGLGVAGPTGLQNQAYQGVSDLQTPGQIGAASQLAGQAGVNALNAQYNASPINYNQVQASQFQAPKDVSAQQVQGPSLQNYQMGPANQVQTQDFTGQNVTQYENPYIQNVVNPQIAAAMQQYGQAGQQEQANATQRGAFGGSREALMAGQNQAAMNQQINNIMGTGYANAFTNAQQQFNQQQQANLQAQTANQQAGLTVGQQNLGANLGVQQLGAQLGQQAQQANQQAGLQAGLANQQVGYNTALQNAQQAQQAALANQQAQLQAQQQGISQQQFGANLGMQGLQQANQAAGTLGNLGTAQLAAQTGILGLQNQLGGQQQQYNQNVLNQAIQNYSNMQQYPQQQVANLMNLIRATPTSQTSTQYQAPPSLLSQAAGLGTAGIAGLGLYNTMSKP